ncbi:site-specific DNA-methyltransferase [Desulfitibacter alkalitolerans]|uniref:site-specific DNA-methyltransferase n=1 Tax=Desulfitibacter alkalitolerans TaxID=264641 RepID=UPI0004830ACF|nr:site-specific DNA-methyltransferase [Desulfitibacter alkalitolerans]
MKSANINILCISICSPTDPEKLGYPTQKPVSLLKRIIESSSAEGDLVLDPFCGCGTTVAASEQLNRKWIGIDITHLAINLMASRLKQFFGDRHTPYEVFGDPKDIHSAVALAKADRYQFQWWALTKYTQGQLMRKRKGQTKE